MLELIQRNGYSGTGLNTVVEHADAPKGSLYFHFPQGKEALGEKAVELAAARFGALVADSALESATGRHLVLALGQAGVRVSTASRSHESYQRLARWLAEHGQETAPADHRVDFAGSSLIEGEFYDVTERA